MSAQVSKLKLFKTETIWDLIVNFSVKKEPKYCSAVDCHFFTIYFSINACLYNIYIFTDKRFKLLILLKSSMALYLIRRRCCCTVYFPYFKPKKNVFRPFSFYTLLHTQNNFLSFFEIASVIVGKIHNIDR